MCYVLPTVFENGEPQLITELAIAKRRLVFKAEADVAENDIEMTAIRVRRKRFD